MKNKENNSTLQISSSQLSQYVRIIRIKERNFKKYFMHLSVEILIQLMRLEDVTFKTSYKTSRVKLGLRMVILNPPI